MKRKTLPAEAGRAEGGRTLDPIISIRGLKKTYHVGEERVREEQVESARGEAEEKERRTTLCRVFDYVANNEPPASFNALLFRL